MIIQHCGNLNLRPRKAGELNCVQFRYRTGLLIVNRCLNCQSDYSLGTSINMKRDKLIARPMLMTVNWLKLFCTYKPNVVVQIFYSLNCNADATTHILMQLSLYFKIRRLKQNRKANLLVPSAQSNEAPDWQLKSLRLKESDYFSR